MVLDQLESLVLDSVEEGSVVCHAIEKSGKTQRGVFATRGIPQWKKVAEAFPFVQFPDYDHRITKIPVRVTRSDSLSLKDDEDPLVLAVVMNLLAVSGRKKILSVNEMINEQGITGIETECADDKVESHVMPQLFGQGKLLSTMGQYADSPDEFRRRVKVLRTYSFHAKRNQKLVDGCFAFGGIVGSLNVACVPNCLFLDEYRPDGSFLKRAVVSCCFIKEGEELTVGLHNDFPITGLSQTKTIDKEFECRCNRCLVSFSDEERKRFDEPIRFDSATEKKEFEDRVRGAIYALYHGCPELALTQSFLVGETLYSCAKQIEGWPMLKTNVLELGLIHAQSILECEPQMNNVESAQFIFCCVMFHPHFRTWKFEGYVLPYLVTFRKALLKLCEPKDYLEFENRMGLFEI